MKFFKRKKYPGPTIERVMYQIHLALCFRGNTDPKSEKRALELVKRLETPKTQKLESTGAIRLKGRLGWIWTFTPGGKHFVRCQKGHDFLICQAATGGGYSSHWYLGAIPPSDHVAIALLYFRMGIEGEKEILRASNMSPISRYDIIGCRSCKDLAINNKHWADHIKPR